MQLSSNISGSYSYNGTQNSSSSSDTIKELEKQKKEIQADITETSSAQESSDTKEKSYNNCSSS